MDARIRRLNQPGNIAIAQLSRNLGKVVVVVISALALLYLARDSGRDKEKTQDAIAAVRRWRDARDLPFPNFRVQSHHYTGDSLTRSREWPNVSPVRTWC
jgi:hypothetical protein